MLIHVQMCMCLAGGIITWDHCTTLVLAAHAHARQDELQVNDCGRPLYHECFFMYTNVYVCLAGGMLTWDHCTALVLAAHAHARQDELGGWLLQVNIIMFYKCFMNTHKYVTSHDVFSRRYKSMGAGWHKLSRDNILSEFLKS